MLRKSMGLAGLSLTAMLLASSAVAAECPKGQSEAVLVTNSGSITMCVDDGIVESQQSGLTVALETIQCPCAEFVPSDRQWSRYKDEQSCEVNSDALVIRAMKGGKGKNGGSEELMFVTDSGACVYEYYYDGLAHRHSRVLFGAPEIEAEACRVFGRELYASFAGSRRQPASCPQ